MIKIFKINKKNFIYQNVGEDLKIWFKDSSNPKTMLTNSIFQYNELANFEIDKIESCVTKTRILGFRNKITNDLISISEYHKIFPNEIIETSKYDFINPSFKLNLFHKEHNLEKENFNEIFEINETDILSCDSNFEIKPCIIDNDSLTFKGSIIKDSIYKNFNLQNVYSYDFNIVCFGLKIQSETLNLVKKEVENLEKIKIGFSILKSLI